MRWDQLNVLRESRLYFWLIQGDGTGVVFRRHSAAACQRWFHHAAEIVERAEQAERDESVVNLPLPTDGEEQN